MESELGLEGGRYSYQSLVSVGSDQRNSLGMAVVPVVTGPVHIVGDSPNWEKYTLPGS